MHLIDFKPLHDVVKLSELCYIHVRLDYQKTQLNLPLQIKAWQCGTLHQKQ